MLHIILFGPPGSGKGTQAQKLVEKYELYHISTGDLFRTEIAEETTLGLKALEYMNQGILVPDEVTLGMLKNKLANLSKVKGFIYDGFPRTIAQAEALDQMLKDNNEEINALIALDVEDDEIVHRIMLRGITSGRSDDLDEVIIRKRMDEYRTKTSSVYNYYAGKSKSHSIEGVGTVREITNKLFFIMDSLC
ncbi:MAG: adenylate kinase [Saprospiraceae bacterium]